MIVLLLIDFLYVKKKESLIFCVKFLIFNQISVILVSGISTTYEDQLTGSKHDEQQITLKFLLVARALSSLHLVVCHVTT